MSTSGGVTPTVFGTAEELSDAAARAIVEAGRASIEACGRYRLLVSGGDSPRRTYELLASRYAADVEWERTHVYFSDERCVPPGDRRNNHRMVDDLLLSRVPVPASSVHPIPTMGAPPELAEAHEALLRTHFARAGTTTFDLALMGMGADGHTASLFPGDPAVGEEQRWVLAVKAPHGVEVTDRITLTLPVLNRARHVLFLVTGAGKRDAAQQALSAPGGSQPLPAALVRGQERTDWLLDSSAAPASLAS